jgi:anti-sigma28 factor (negative regulator of flagellin synthesis)
MADPRPEQPEPTPELEDLEEAYSPEYLRECAGGSAREERLEELKRRIAAGAYRINADWVAEELLSRGDLDSD